MHHTAEPVWARWALALIVFLTVAFLFATTPANAKPRQPEARPAGGHYKLIPPNPYALVDKFNPDVRSIA